MTHMYFFEVIFSHQDFGPVSYDRNVSAGQVSCTSQEAAKRSLMDVTYEACLCTTDA